MITQDIRQSFVIYSPSTVFNYGRPADTTLAAAKIEIDDWFVHLDPVSTDGTMPDKNLTTSVSLGFLRQDTPDSEYDDAQELSINDSIEKLQADAQTFAIGWLDFFMDNYGRKYGTATFRIQPATRVKNVMSGILFNVTFTYKAPC